MNSEQPAQAWEEYRFMPGRLFFTSLRSANVACGDFSPRIAQINTDNLNGVGQNEGLSAIYF